MILHAYFDNIWKEVFKLNLSLLEAQTICTTRKLVLELDALLRSLIAVRKHYVMLSLLGQGLTREYYGLVPLTHGAGELLDSRGIAIQTKISALLLELKDGREKIRQYGEQNLSFAAEMALEGAVLGVKKRMLGELEERLSGKLDSVIAIGEQLYIDGDNVSIGPLKDVEDEWQANLQLQMAHATHTNLVENVNERRSQDNGMGHDEPSRTDYDTPKTCNARRTYGCDTNTTFALPPNGTVRGLANTSSSSSTQGFRSGRRYEQLDAVASFAYDSFTPSASISQKDTHEHTVILTSYQDVLHEDVGYEHGIPIHGMEKGSSRSGGGNGRSKGISDRPSPPSPYSKGNNQVSGSTVNPSPAGTDSTIKELEQDGEGTFPLSQSQNSGGQENEPSLSQNSFNSQNSQVLIEPNVKRTRLNSSGE
jgi:hypothetical protein